MDREHLLKIRRKKTIESSRDTATPSTPPSSMRALEFLIGFCTLHDVQSQLFAALAVAIILPAHNFYVMPAIIPSLTAKSYIKIPTVENPDADVLIRHIPCYMALSCNFQAVISSLCGIIWEPAISCNLVSPWLYPVLSEARMALSSSSPSYDEIPCIMCALCRPSLASLWLGATLSGLTPLVIDLVRDGTPPLDPYASAWTGCPQSFMDIPGSGPYAKCTASGTKLARADAWRLLYPPPVIDDDLHYNSPPSSPWEPVGMTTLENSAIRVRIHGNCPRHPLLYCRWCWLQKDGSTMDDEGFDWGLQHIDATARVVIPSQPLVDQEASMTASCEVFGWVTRNCEGYSPESIYLDKWLREDESEASEPANDSDTSDSKRYDDKTVDHNQVATSIQEWLAGAE